MYKIKINNMRFHSHIGVYDEEKKIGQNIEIDLTVYAKYEDFDDNIENTHSYGDFYRLIAKIVDESRVDLIETLAQTIIKSIKNLAPDTFERVNVKIRKLAVPIDGIFDSVEIEMED